MLPHPHVPTETLPDGVPRSHRRLVPRLFGMRRTDKGLGSRVMSAQAQKGL
jgi:hypothetical protein